MRPPAWEGGSSRAARLRPVPGPFAVAKGWATEPRCLSAPCPRSAVPIPEPSFPLYLDVLAPYVNQVNLIRAGVPKIVSRLHFPLSPYLEASAGRGLGLCTFRGFDRVQTQGLRGRTRPTKLVGFPCVFLPGQVNSCLPPRCPRPRQSLSRGSRVFMLGGEASAGAGKSSPVLLAVCLVEFLGSGPPQHPPPHPHPQGQEVARGQRAANLPRVSESLQI